MRQTRSAPAPFPAVEPAADVLEVVESFETIGKPDAIAGRPHLVRFRDERGDWLARRLRGRVPADEIARRHAFLAALADRPGIVAPQPHPDRSVVVLDHADIEVVSYLPGTSWAANGRLVLGGRGLMRPLLPPGRDLTAITAMVAAIHQVEPPPNTLPVLSLRDYLHHQRSEWRAISEHIARSGRREVHIQRWQSASQRVIYAAWDVLDEAGLLGVQTGVPSHHDLWPAHTLTHQSHVSLIDWSRARITSPLVDVAQLIARFNGWSATSLEEVVESYMAQRTLTADERRLLPVFGALDLAVETGILLAEAYVADIDQTSQYAELARSGAGAMLASLESIGWSIRKSNLDSKELRREARERARAVREPGRKPRPKQLTSKRPKQ